MSNNSLLAGGNQFIGNSLGVDEHAKIVGQNVARWREKAGLSQADLADKIGANSQNTVAAIEKGKTQRSRFLPRIARALKVSLADLDDQYEGEEVERIPAPQLASELNLKVYASVEVSDGTVVLSSEPVQMTRRPASLEAVRDAYGMIVQGESMEPAARQGDTVLINPHLPPRNGDLCLFFADKGGELRGTLKEYRGQTADAWLVKRYRPGERNYALKKADLPKCHVVVTVNRR